MNEKYHLSYWLYLFGYVRSTTKISLYFAVSNELYLLHENFHGKVSLEKFLGNGIWYFLVENALFGGFLVDFLIKIGDRIELPK